MCQLYPLFHMIPEAELAEHERLCRAAVSEHLATSKSQPGTSSGWDGPLPLPDKQ